jgi:DNA-binding NtrC family response regulator
MDASPLVAKAGVIGVIDDEWDIVQLYRDALLASGFSVYAFTNPLIALEHFKVNSNSYVVIISDLRMPGMDGIELIKRVKAINPDIRALLITAFEVEDSVFHEYKKGNLIDYILRKPVTMKNLVTEVENQVKIQQLQEQK